MSDARVTAAVRDLERHTLGGLPGELSRLVYLASTRDYNTGQYHHDGLALVYTAKAAQAALQQCHNSVFRTLAGENLEALIREIRAYLEAKPEHAEQVLSTWRGLEPYRMLVPAGCDTRVRDLFLSNFTGALAIVRSQDQRLDSSAEPQQR